jgi:hypothetical protein
LVAAAVLSASVPALAQYQQQPYPGPPPPQSAQAPNGEYVAPIQQQTQPVYVPQSVAMSGPRTIRDWDESEPVPPGYHVSTRIRKGLVVGGAVMFGSMYLISVIAAAAVDDAAKDPYTSTTKIDAMYIPAAGPFLQMGQSGTSSTGTVFLAIDGLVQCGGLAMLIYGLAAPQTYLVRNDLATTEMPPQPKLQLTPMHMGREGYGFGVIGRF